MARNIPTGELPARMHTNLTETDPVGLGTKPFAIIHDRCDRCGLAAAGADDPLGIPTSDGCEVTLTSNIRFEPDLQFL